MTKPINDKSGIYCIHNTINGKRYIGQSVSLFYRKSQHFCHLKYNSHYNTYLQNAFNKYGKNNFEWIILEEVPLDMLDFREKSWINYYKSNQSEFGYNYETGGHALKILSMETRRKMSEANKGKSKSKEHRQRISEARIGIKCAPLSEETKKKISLANKGKTRTAEQRQRMSLACMGRKFPPFSEEHKRKIGESNKGKHNYWKGRHHPHSLETRIKIGKAHKGMRYKTKNTNPE